MRLSQILYCSRNRLSGPDTDVRAGIDTILAISRTNNMRDGLSGFLLLSDGCFAQVLEGPIEKVEATFERIQCDDRHGEVTVIDVRAIEARDFPDWSMAFGGIDDAARAPDLDPGRASSGRSADGDALLRVMKDLVIHERDRPTARPH